MSSNRFVATVSQVNRRIAVTLKKDAELDNLYVRGEISNFICHYKSGHVYFTLKDSDSSLKCVMFAPAAEKLTFLPENGQNIIAGGKIGVYERDGAYQLYAATLEAPEEKQEEESLYASFLKLKETLEKEGVFSNSRPLPAYPERICLITAKDGAALQDMLSVFARRYPVLEVLLIPALVQGAGAPASLTKALKAANRENCDLIILARGGGSAEDLWAFNDEGLTRAVYASDVPVVSAVGHETDFTLVDFAADLRAPTPSAAAELATPDLSELPLMLDNLLADLKRRVFAVTERKQSKLEHLEREISRRIKNIISYKKQELLAVENVINALNPERVFARGFAAVFDKDGAAVKSSENIKINDELNIRLAEGNLTVIVKEKTQRRTARPEGTENEKI
ncbi:MAG: exodeoxyribonuclease VII large subunit [Oscillospiraceae bacterium]|jgi:exodeoxyribonuclease VII large subunit|nr:exodeoxyribonuclease VII large subunit [Oscillospiraceae bacterium]